MFFSCWSKLEYIEVISPNCSSQESLAIPNLDTTDYLNSGGAFFFNTKADKIIVYNGIFKM